MYLEYYKKQLGDVPQFLEKYLKTPSLVRLKKVGYFCGMDDASKDVYQFREWISRYDHSLTVALMVWGLTGDKKATLAGLFHDIATPCFSHVIDYMNQDFEKQESTEEFTEEILKKDLYLQRCLAEDGINLEDTADFKKYSVVDNERPKLCADRLDGIILTGIGWTKDITYDDISNILNCVLLFRNSDGEEEIGFSDSFVGERVLEISRNIDELCHSNEDNYMMSLLGDITKLAIEDHLVSYPDLFSYTEEELFQLFKQSSNVEIQVLLDKFYHITKDEIPKTDISNVKRRIIHPIVCGERLV